MKSKYLGWIVAVALVAVAAATGFQGAATKVGVVDYVKVFNDSDYAKSQVDDLKAFQQARMDMLEFVRTYRTFTVEQATQFHDLSIKPTLTAAEKAQLDKIKTDVQTSDTRLKNLQQKSNPTPDEQKEMGDLQRRVQTMTDTAQGWAQEAQDQLDSKRQASQQAGMDKVKDAIKQVASSQGYTVVFVSDVAPYGANDITADALKAMNKK